jgi:gliding motility-associated-like protein
MKYLFIILFSSFTFLVKGQAPSAGFLGRDTLVCDSTNVKLSAPAGYKYLWSTDDTTRTIKGFESRKYWVRITDPGGNVYTDTIDVTLKSERSNRANHWYFGNGAAIKFDSLTGEVSADNTPLNFDFANGTTAVSHGDGSLLFYSNGSTIYNKNHQILEKGIKGDSTLPQNSIIIPEPESNRYFYLFTVKNDSLFYTQIDRDAAPDGNGKVTSKNVFLFKPVNSALTAAKSGDTTWLITHVQNTNTFLSFPVTSDGAPFTPVTSSAGTATDNNPVYLKGNSDGTKLVITGTSTELFDFDGITGQVSNPIKVNIPGASSAEFTQDGGSLFINTGNSTTTGGTASPGGSMYKIDPATGFATDTLFTNDTLKANLGTIQLGPDGKIYMAKGDSCLAVIDADTLNYYGLCLNSRKIYQSLPNFPPQFFKPPVGPGFSGNNACLGTPINFTGSNPWEDKDYITVSFVYDFGDGSPKVFTKDATHTYSGPGNYTVKATITANSCKPETSELEITIYPIPDLSHIKPDYTICANDSVKIDARNNGAAYLWSTGSTAQTETFRTGGTYNVLVGYDASCIRSKQFTVTEKPIPDVTAGPDVKTCTGVPVTLTAQANNVTYSWSNGQTSKTINPATSGRYIIEVSDGTCKNRDTVNVTFLPRPVTAGFTERTVTCNDQQILDAGNPGFRYRWSTGDTTQTITARNSGTYTVEIYLDGCSEKFTTELKINRTRFSITGDSIFCEKERQVTLDAGPGNAFEWSTGETTQTILVKTGGTYSVRKTDLNNCTTSQNKVVQSICTPTIDVPTAFTPNNDGDNDFFKPLVSRLTSYELRIFNRWGEIIFFTNNHDEGWDGSYKNKPVPPGAYVYSITYEGEGTSNQVEKNTIEGQITVLR